MSTDLADEDFNAVHIAAGGKFRARWDLVHDAGLHPTLSGQDFLACTAQM